MSESCLVLLGRCLCCVSKLHAHVPAIDQGILVNDWHMCAEREDQEEQDSFRTRCWQDISQTCPRGRWRLARRSGPRPHSIFKQAHERVGSVLRQFFRTRLSTGIQNIESKRNARGSSLRPMLIFQRNLGLPDGDLHGESHKRRHAHVSQEAGLLLRSFVKVTIIWMYST